MFWDNTYIFIIQVHKEHEIKCKPLTIVHFLCSSGFSTLFLLPVPLDVASSSSVKTSLINSFSIFLSGLLADKQLFGDRTNPFLTPLNFHFLTKVSCFYHPPRKKMFIEIIFFCRRVRVESPNQNPYPVASTPPNFDSLPTRVYPHY